MKCKPRLSYKILNLILMASCLSSYQSALAAENIARGVAIVVTCEKGKWEGQRVGFKNDGVVENDSNGQQMEETVFIFQQLPFEKGGTVFVRYGEEPDNKDYTGEIRYFYSNGIDKAYVMIETKPEQIMENYVIDTISGNVILSVTKSLFGMYKDVFTKKCTTKMVQT